MVYPGSRCWAPRCLHLDRLQPALPAGRWCAPPQRCRMGGAHAPRGTVGCDGPVAPDASARGHRPADTGHSRHRHCSAAAKASTDRPSPPDPGKGCAYQSSREVCGSDCNAHATPCAAGARTLAGASCCGGARTSTSRCSCANTDTNTSTGGSCRCRCRCPIATATASQTPGPGGSGG